MSALSTLLTADFAQRAGIAFALTLLWIAVVWTLLQLGAALLSRCRVMINKWVTQNGLSRLLRKHADWPAGAADSTLRVLGALLMLLVTYEWMVRVFAQFDFTASWAADLNAALWAAVQLIALAIASAIPDLLVVLVIALLTIVLVKLNKAFFGMVERGQLHFEKLDAEAARATRKLVTFALWIFALVMAYPYLPGSQSDAFKGVSVLLGVMVSLGSSSVVAQAFSGLILIYSRALRPGEYVKIGESEGTVLEIGLFATHIETGSGERIVLPNSQVVATSTRNFSRPASGGKFVVHTKVSIGYPAPWRQVHAMLIEAAGRTAGIANEPAAYVLQTALSDFYVEYRLVAFSDLAHPGQRADMLSALHGHIQDVFDENGVRIMSPHYLSDPAWAHAVPKEQVLPSDK